MRRIGSEEVANLQYTSHPSATSYTHVQPHTYTFETEDVDREDFRSVSGDGGVHGQGFGMGNIEVLGYLWGIRSTGVQTVFPWSLYSFHV